MNKKIRKSNIQFYKDPKTTKGNKNLRIPVLVNHEFSQSIDFLEKTRPYTFQMGSRLSLEIKNKNIHVLDCEKSIVQYALYYLTLLILK